MEGVEMVRLVSFLSVLILWPGLSRAMEGVPPSYWFAEGAPIPENSYLFSADAEGGYGAGFVGGEAKRSMKADRYLAVPLVLRYGFLRGWELYGVLPYFWGSSDQEFVNYQTLGDPQVFHDTVSGGDFGDIATAVKWAVWESDERDSAVCVHLGGRFATGTDPWQYSQNNFGTRMDTPRMSHGDGAGGGVMQGVQFVSRSMTPRVDGYAGYIYNLPFRANGIDTVKSHINVTPPSPLTGRVRGSFVIDGSWWAGLDMDGFWAPAGRIRGTGDFALEPGSLPHYLDSYSNLVKQSGGLWMGVSTGADLSPEAGVSIGVKAPVAVNRDYRFWRADVKLVYSASLFK
jgi:hypothetical protein